MIVRAILTAAALLIPVLVIAVIAFGTALQVARVAM